MWSGYGTVHFVLRRLFHPHLALQMPFQLKELYLKDVGMGDAGLKELCKMLQNMSLIHLDLSNNGFTDNGMSHFCRALPQLGDLELLNMSSLDKVPMDAVTTTCIAGPTRQDLQIWTPNASKSRYSGSAPFGALCAVPALCEN